MVTGIEAAGLALALLPLLVNQIDGYARGIEKTRRLKYFQRDFVTYCVGLNTQHTMLQSVLEQVLEDIVEDEEAVAALIQNPRAAGWRSPELLQALRTKLGRNYEPFVGNMNELCELLERLSTRLGFPTTDTGSFSTEALSLLKFRKILNRSVYDDLLGKIYAANSILQTLIDQTNHLEERRKRRPPWAPLLKQYQRERQHAESLFQAIAGGHCWQCRCRELHCVHLQLQANLVEHASNPLKQKPQSSFRIVFSNVLPTNITGVWDWREVMFEPQEIKFPQISTHSSSEQPGRELKRQRVRFEDVSEKTTQIMPQIDLTTSQIQDLCSSLQGCESPVQQQTPIGFILEDQNPAFRYVMHAVQSIQHKALKHSLREALTSMSRRDRLHIAASIACAVLQYHGNWLKDQWDSSDFHLVAESLDSVFLSWPLSNPCSLKGSSTLSSSDKRESVLQSLGLSLVELSLGRPLDAVLVPNGATQDDKGTRIDTALSLKVMKKVDDESGNLYANIVDSCLSWSGVSAICRESHSFEEQIFDKIVSPLLKHVMIFEGMGGIEGMS